MTEQLRLLAMTVVLTVLLTIVLAVAELILRWWRDRPMRSAMFAFAGLFSAAAICWWFQLAAAAEWLGTLAFGALVLGLVAMLNAPASSRETG